MNASDRITNHVNEFGDWRGKTMARLRELIRAAAPDLVKVNFFKGASLEDSNGLFNAGLDAKASRAIDIHQGERINEAAFKALVRAAVALTAGELPRKI